MAPSSSTSSSYTQYWGIQRRVLLNDSKVNQYNINEYPHGLAHPLISSLYFSDQKDLLKTIIKAQKECYTEATAPSIKEEQSYKEDEKKGKKNNNKRKAVEDDDDDDNDDDLLGLTRYMESEWKKFCQERGGLNHHQGSNLIMTMNNTKDTTQNTDPRMFGVSSTKTKSENKSYMYKASIILCRLQVDLGNYTSSEVAAEIYDMFALSRSIIANLVMKDYNIKRMKRASVASRNETIKALENGLSVLEAATKATNAAKAESNKVIAPDNRTFHLKILVPELNFPIADNNNTWDWYKARINTQVSQMLENNNNPERSLAQILHDNILLKAEETQVVQVDTDDCEPNFLAVKKIEEDLITAKIRRLQVRLNENCQQVLVQASNIYRLIQLENTVVKPLLDEQNTINKQFESEYNELILKKK